jgi:branched-chain amino acid transport system substrate-binding protein
VEFDAKGDRKDAEMTIFRMGKDGKIQPVAIVKNGVSAPFSANAAPAAAAPAAAPAAATPPAGSVKPDGTPGVPPPKNDKKGT